MAIGEVFAAPVESLVLGGQGLIRLDDGRVVFMPFTAPGDKVAGRIISEKKNRAEAELLELTEPSPLREEPACPLYGRCGGCSIQHISYQAQLEVKKAMLLDALRSIGGLVDLPPVKVIASEPWEYRNRVTFHAIRANRGPKAGFKAHKSDEVIPVPDCPVAAPGIRSLLRSGAIVPPVGKDRFTIYARGPVLLGNGVSRGTTTVLDKTITLDADCFFQSNGALLEKCAADLRTAAAGVSGSFMADLYAGVGTFSVVLADLFSGADLLEENPAALELARHNLVPDTGKYRFFSQTDERWARSNGGSSGRGGGSYGFLVADPPRQGLSRSMAEWIAGSGPPVAAYLSCNPASLARDCRILSRAYTVKELYFYDFYPQTAHIESLAVLWRKEKL
jgi:23S rRNA (uracil1939-C5)-methyltransferase